MPNYSRLFNSMSINAVRRRPVDAIVDRILLHRTQYEQIGAKTGIPWYVVAVIHYRESDLDFSTHLHNGDPLTARTTHVPAGRPAQGNPPFSFVVSAIDALTDRARPSDELVGTLLSWIELYNGGGYIRKNMNSPYVWSFSNQYGSGKYVSDGRFDKDAVDGQCGAAPILLRMHEREIIVLQGGEPVSVTVAGKATSIPARVLRGNTTIRARGVTDALGAVISGVGLDPVCVGIASAGKSKQFSGYQIGTSVFVDASDLVTFLGHTLVYDAATKTSSIR